ncbi:sterol desaturase family protein [Aquimarina intermedia]|uniref:Sterol desaturase/sphingolipid hydroxylase (Fatty acid hydroxylase superfamily) n=1 Tax=Aquimarina intermedia TaxID=350814 RepID=A0A5S5CF06_9FLAO|nr:sterol desaturase family protein [Aquimarina intermedia]TYP77092.1 sterol desaturase/sphingolipid hydroxylase (fatty acid hydroxylase superfamily) [Aquimarina intermedia]
METYATALSYAIPGFIVLILIEYAVSRLKRIQVNQPLDTISSISSGITNTLKTLMGLAVVIISYDWMVNHIALLEIKSTIAVYALTFIGLDFAGYWSHRFNHTINVFWNRHIIHHSSEEFNLACALRQNISAIFSIYFFLYIPLALLGVPAEVVAFVAPVHFFAQFWYHTRLIKKMGILEYILVTPSHHRVHHAINDEYLDKNYSEIFILWDKLFGTFQEELPEKPPVYGVKKPVNTWNPILINYIHFWQILKDAWRTKRVWDKVRIWFMPTGWRPQDMIKKHPLLYTTDPYTRKKYSTESSLFLKLWSWFQLLMTVLLMYYLLISVANLTLLEIVNYAIFLMVSIFAYTSLMDRHIVAVYSEFIKASIGSLLIIQRGGSWFGIDTYLPYTTYIIALYIGLSLFLTCYFHFIERKQNVPSLERVSKSA